MTVPQAEVLGLTLPDPDLRLDEATGHYTFGAIDWSEFFEVLKGNGPCNAERIEHRRRAHDEGAWVREAAAAYADKQAARRAGRCRMSSRERRRADDRARVAAVGGVRALPPRAVPPARRQPARAGRRDGAAQRPRRLHPPLRGRLDLGGAGDGDHRVQPGREGLVLRPGGRQGLPAPDVLRDPRRGRSTSDDHHHDRPRHLRAAPRRRRAGRSPTGSASGSPTRRSSRRTWRWRTSPSTCSARRAPC